jgi:uncharacterized membrane protein YbhN (UPF0104 family)
MRRCGSPHPHAGDIPDAAAPARLDTEYMPAEDLALPSLDLRVLARRAAVPAAAAAALVAAVLVLGGPLETFADAVRRAIDADPAWVVAAAAFELLSFAGYIALLWLVGNRASARLGLRESAEITLGGAAATRLLPTAGAGGAAMTLWALRRSGMGTRRAAGTLLTFLVIVYAVFMGALALSGTVLTLHGIGPVALTALPAALGAAVILLALGAAAWMPTEGTGRLRTAGAVLGGAVRDAIEHVRSADPRLLGAFAWWGFDMAVLYGMLNAFGTAPPFSVVVLAYFLGQIANTVPVPGAASGGLVGVLLAFGVGADLAIVSVLAYRAMAIWIPAPIGLVALGKLRQTMARWAREDAEPVEAEVEFEVEVVRPRPYEGRQAWRPLEVPAAA